MAFFYAFYYRLITFKGVPLSLQSVVFNHHWHCNEYNTMYNRIEYFIVTIIDTFVQAMSSLELLSSINNQRLRVSSSICIVFIVTFKLPKQRMCTALELNLHTTIAQQYWLASSLPLSTSFLQSTIIFPSLLTCQSSNLTSILSISSFLITAHSFMITCWPTNKLQLLWWTSINWWVQLSGNVLCGC